MTQLNLDDTGRQNVGRVDHVVYHYPSRQSRDAARADFAAKFGFDGWMEIGEIEGANLDVIVDWNSGIELLAPLDEPGGDPAGHGSLQAVVFGVADLDAAVARANANGARTIPVVLSARVEALTAERFSIGREAIIPAEDMGGLPIVLGEFAPLPGSETTRIDERGRLYPGAVDHLVFAFADENLLAKAQERMAAVLGVDEWHDLGVLHPGALRVVIAPKAGLEFICPGGAGCFLDQHIAQNGSVSFFSPGDRLRRLRRHG